MRSEPFLGPRLGNALPSAAHRAVLATTMLTMPGASHSRSRASPVGILSVVADSMLIPIRAMDSTAASAGLDAAWRC